MDDFEFEDLDDFSDPDSPTDELGWLAERNNRVVVADEPLEQVEDLPEIADWEPEEEADDPIVPAGVGGTIDITGDITLDLAALQIDRAGSASIVWKHNDTALSAVLNLRELRKGEDPNGSIHSHVPVPAEPDSPFWLYSPAKKNLKCAKPNQLDNGNESYQDDTVYTCTASDHMDNLGVETEAKLSDEDEFLEKIEVKHVENDGIKIDDEDDDHSGRFMLDEDRRNLIFVQTPVQDKIPYSVLKRGGVLEWRMLV